MKIRNNRSLLFYQNINGSETCKGENRLTWYLVAYSLLPRPRNQWEAVWQWLHRSEWKALHSAEEKKDDQKGEKTRGGIRRRRRRRRRRIKAPHRKKKKTEQSISKTDLKEDPQNKNKNKTKQNLRRRRNRNHTTFSTLGTLGSPDRSRGAISVLFSSVLFVLWSSFLCFFCFCFFFTSKTRGRKMILINHPHIN